MKRLSRRGRIIALVAAAITVATFTIVSVGGAGASNRTPREENALLESHSCNLNAVLCAEPRQNWEDYSWWKKVQAEGVDAKPYIGHDEPSVLFYSNKAGSGNDANYQLKLPTQPPVRPRPDGSGGTFDFELHPAFWFGMILCDDQGGPNAPFQGQTYPSTPCKPDSDSNIFTSLDPSDPHYIGKSPGQAFMEFQFYPPGWVYWNNPFGPSCDPTKWCAALTIDTFQFNDNDNVVNNTACLNGPGFEPQQFAFITKSGSSLAPGNALDPNRYAFDPKKVPLFGPGDQLSVDMHDTSAGFRVVVKDHTSGEAGSMTASKANGFGSVNFEPNANSCTVTTHAIHPMYATSGPDTRVLDAAHSYNVSYSDEIGHFQYCNKVDQSIGYQPCTASGGFDTHNTDGDDYYCAPAAQTTLVHISGCTYTNGDNDGPSYDAHAWPGSTKNAKVNKLLTPSPIMFTSPTTKGGAQYSQVAFETDLPRLEGADEVLFPGSGIQHICQRHLQNPADPHPGLGCLNPPPQARFYPFYTTTVVDGQCWWQEGGNDLPHTKSHFGGSSKTEYGPILANAYASDPAGTVQKILENFHRTLKNNPCT